MTKYISITINEEYKLLEFHKLGKNELKKLEEIIKNKISVENFVENKNYKIKNAVKFKNIRDLLDKIKLEIKNDYSTWIDYVNSGKYNVSYFVSTSNIFKEALFIYADITRKNLKDSGHIIYGMPVVKLNELYLLWPFG